MGSVRSWVRAPPAKQRQRGSSRSLFSNVTPYVVGERPFSLGLALPLIVALGLEPTQGICGLSLTDRNGHAVVGRLWQPPRPRRQLPPAVSAVEGADVLLRPDLAQQLHRIAGESRLQVGVWADYHSAWRASSSLLVLLVFMAVADVVVVVVVVQLWHLSAAGLIG